MRKQRQTITIELKPTREGDAHIPALKWILKRVWRVWGLKCVSLKVTGTDEPQTTGAKQ